MKLITVHLNDGHELNGYVQSETTSTSGKKVEMTCVDDKGLIFIVETWDEDK